MDIINQQIDMYNEQMDLPKLECDFCHEEFFVIDIFSCNICMKSICNVCSKNNGKWVHHSNDCNFCVDLFENGINGIDYTPQSTAHTLYFVCSFDCEHIFEISYY